MSDDELRKAAVALSDRATDSLEEIDRWGGPDDDDMETVDTILAEKAVAARLLELLPPADDAEPVTAEWLTACGFMVGKFPDDLVIGPVLRGVIHNAQSPANGRWYWTVRSYPIPMEHEPTTRGHVRRLCSALGIQLKGNK